MAVSAGRDFRSHHLATLVKATVPRVSRPRMSTEDRRLVFRKGTSSMGDPLRNVTYKKDTVHSERLGLDFTVYVQNELESERSSCYIMTIHDIGTTHSEFHSFVNHPSTQMLRNRIIWLHVELPGQENDAPDLDIKHYPSLDELAKELIIVLEAAKVSQPILMGEGVGANIATRFAMLYPTICLGLVLIRPTGTSAGIKETLMDKLYQWRLSNTGMVNVATSYLSWNAFGESHAKLLQSAKMQRRNTTPAEDAFIRFKNDLENKRNPKNLALMFGSITSRTDITDKMGLVKCDVLVVCGKQTAVLHTTNKFFQKFQESRQSDDETVRKCENSTLITFNDVANVLVEAPGQLAQAMLYFLKGLGLLSSIPLVPGLEGLGKRHGRISMAIADKPRTFMK